MNGSNQAGGLMNNMIDVDGDSSVELLSKEIQKERSVVFMNLPILLFIYMCIFDVHTERKLYQAIFSCS